MNVGGVRAGMRWKRNGIMLWVVWLVLSRVLTQGADAELADVGGYYPFLKRHAERSPRSLSYLAREWEDRDLWRRTGRTKMLELLSYREESTPLASEALEVVRKPGYTRTRVRYAVGEGRKTEAFLLIPEGLKGPTPAVVAIHDHGGFYYYGKEKITETEDSPLVLREFIQTSYGGRAYADELARRGFVVLVPDGFYFGSQRLDVTRMDARFSGDLKGLKEGSDDYIRKFNRIASNHEALMAKTIYAAGSTWPGILFHGDRVAVDYLLSRPEVDPKRVGCIGLSIGGIRSAHLAGLDPRIKASVVAGWMVTYESLLKDHLRSHTWMIYVPGQLRYLDLPDVVSLNAPNPLMLVQCLQDQLFTLDGMKAAEARLGEVYGKMGVRDRFECRYYDVPHSLTIPMQDDAIRWLERWLRE